MSMIDLSAATPATRDHVAEKNFEANLQTTALAQMLSLIVPPHITNPLQRQAIELIQTEGIGVATEFLALKCDLGDNEWVKLIRAQIVAAHAKGKSDAEEAFQQQQEAAAAAPAADPVQDGVLHVSVGYAPEANKENAGAIRTALLAGFVQLSQQFPDSVIEPTIARVALQWIPTEDSGEDSGYEARVEAGERRDWEGSEEIRPA
jgi:hypothetical protein